MTNEREQIDELGDDAKSLLRSARTGGWDAPPAGAKDRVRTALAIAIAGTSAAAAGSALGAGTAKAAAAASVASTGAATSTAVGSAASATAGASSAAGSVAAATAGTGTVAAAGMFSGLAAKVAIAAIAVSAVGGTIALNRFPADEPAHVVDVAASAGREEGPARYRSGRRTHETEPLLEVAPLAPVVEPAGEAITETVEAVETAPVEAVRAPRIERALPEVEPAPAAEAVPASTLEDERLVLDRARVTLARDNPAGALSVVDEYRARFPGGRMLEDAAAIEVRALCRMHDPRADGARSDFSRRYPGSLHAGRVARDCE
jgi:hypothetical protein